MPETPPDKTPPSFLIRPSDVARTVRRPQFGLRVSRIDMVGLPGVAGTFPPPANPAAPRGRTNLSGTLSIVPGIVVSFAVGVAA